MLTGANLSRADLSRAKLVKARLDGVNLAGANLKGTDLRGAQGLRREQLNSALHAEKAILDEKMLATLGMVGDPSVARHGKPAKKASLLQIDLTFKDVKPRFGDVFLLCGFDHPDFSPTGYHGFAELADLEIEQVDDYFALCIDGDPAVWVFPLVGGAVVAHHPGPYDAPRLQADNSKHNKLFSKCVARFEEALRIPPA